MAFLWPLIWQTALVEVFAAAARIGGASVGGVTSRRGGGQPSVALDPVTKMTTSEWPTNQARQGGREWAAGIRIRPDQAGSRRI